MASVAKVILVGNAGRDAELAYSPTGTPVTKFSLAVSRKRRDASGESSEVTTWYNITLFGKQAETASEYVKKGKSVYVDGRLEPRDYTDKDGKARIALDVVANDFQLMGSRSDGQTGNASGGSQAGELSGGEDFPF